MFQRAQSAAQSAAKGLKSAAKTVKENPKQAFQKAKNEIRDTGVGAVGLAGNLAELGKEHVKEHVNQVIDTSKQLSDHDGTKTQGDIIREGAKNLKNSHSKRIFELTAKSADLMKTHFGEDGEKAVTLAAQGMNLGANSAKLGHKMMSGFLSKAKDKLNENKDKFKSDIIKQLSNILKEVGIVEDKLETHHNNSGGGKKTRKTRKHKKSSRKTVKKRRTRKYKRNSRKKAKRTTRRR